MVTVTQTTTKPTQAILKLRAEGRIAESDLPTEAKMAEVSSPPDRVLTTARTPQGATCGRVPYLC